MFIVADLVSLMRNIFNLYMRRFFFGLVYIYKSFLASGKFASLSITLVNI